MDIYNSMFTALALIVLPGLMLVFARKFVSKKPNLPPGPPGWPLVGNLFQAARSGKQFFEFVRDLVPDYGPIFTLKMGTRTMIIITSADLAYEALIEKGQVFATRPDENPTRTIFSCNKFTVNSSSYGPVWRSLRRNLVQNMLSSSRIREFHNLRMSAMDRLINRLKSEADANNGVVWVLKNVRFAFFCILLAMCFGNDLDEETNERVDHMMKKVLNTLEPRVDDFLPVLGIFFSKQKKKAIEVRKEQLETLIPLVKRRRSTRDDSVISFSYLDTLFDLEIEGRKAGLNDTEIVTLCSEFLNGGTDTTATALEWAIARFIDNPNVQSKLYDEIVKTVGKNKKIDEKDIEKMPYLNAVTKELLRKHPPTYFVLSHAVTEPSKLAGYGIPLGTTVEFFTPPIGNDPKIWSDPEKFNPDRFLIGGEDADITGVTGVKMMPFSVGRRICPGASMATIHLNLMIARLVQEFEWSAYPENNKVDFSEKLEFTVVMKNPLRAMIKPRV
nr:PREDICTED: cytochrome P450 77A3-like [Daucus carota subsp. sativus]